MRRIWLVRHGNTFERGQPPRRIGCRTDLPLTEEGRAQADRLGQLFARREIVFDHVYASPLHRAHETAARVVHIQQCVIETMAVLLEIDHGPDEGQPEDVVRQRVGEAALERWDRLGEAPREWLVDAEAREADWRRFFADQAALGAGDSLCVSSNGALRFALLAMRREAQTALPQSLSMRTGALGLVELSDHEILLRHWNRRPEEF